MPHLTVIPGQSCLDSIIKTSVSQGTQARLCLCLLWSSKRTILDHTMQETLRGGGGEALQCRCQYESKIWIELKQSTSLTVEITLFNKQRHLSLALFYHKQSIAALVISQMLMPGYLSDANANFVCNGQLRLSLRCGKILQFFFTFTQQKKHNPCHPTNQK